MTVYLYIPTSISILLSICIADFIHVSFHRIVFMNDRIYLSCRIYYQRFVSINPSISSYISTTFIYFHCIYYVTLSINLIVSGSTSTCVYYLHTCYMENDNDIKKPLSLHVVVQQGFMNKQG